jgi:hypothetical protein
LTDRDGFRNKLFDTLETQIDQNFGWSLDLALALYDYRVIQDEAGDLIKMYMCFMILYVYRGPIDEMLVKLYGSINQERLKLKYPRQYFKYFLRVYERLNEQLSN